MISRMKIENYKCFESLELPDVSRITLIGGQNNVGKTSLLEAIFLFYDTADPGMFFRHLGWRGIEAALADPNTSVSPMFRDFNMERPLRISVSDSIYSGEMEIRFNSSHVEKSINVDLSNVSSEIPQVKTDQIPLLSYALDIHYVVDGQSEQNVSLVVRQSSTNLNIQFASGPVSPPPGMIRNVIFLPLRTRIDPGEDASRLAQLDIEKRAARVVELLRVIEPSLVGLSAVPLVQQRPAVYADIGMSRKIPIAYMGDGMSRLLSLILAIAAAKDGIVLVDEIDAGIHHSVLAKVWEGICRAARDFNCQIFATTHSYECLQAASEGCTQADASREFRYIRLDHLGKEIVAKTYTYDILGSALERGWEVR